MPQQPSSHSSGTKNGSQKKDDPTDSLQQALANFQDSLTAEQQKKLTASTVVPNAEEVLYFVAKLDAENGSKTRRSVSPRLCTFLSAVQQFAGAVETFVSSNPKIGALIWGSIKTAMTMAGNIASYFDKITKMIEKIGRFCPTYQKFGQLYQGCVGLQQALCEYYVVIVELCTKVIKISQRTWASQTFSPILNPFESEFESFLERLEAASEQIHQQTSLASKQANLEAKKLLELESKENVLFRSSALELLGKVKRHTEKTSEWRICQTEREIASLKGKIRNNLSPVDHMRPWNRALKQKVQSTADWLIHDPTFLEWRDSPDSTILWCSGTMGVGKTILMSSVISHLRASRQNNKSVAVAYFLCLAENEDSLSARNLVGSLTRQLLDRHIDECTHSTLLSLQSESQSFYTNDIAQLLLSHLTADNTYYIVLDGLDECGLTQVREMANILALFFKSKRLKIICASRPELEEDLFKCVKPQHRVVMDEEKVTRDIALYITATLYDCLEEGTLVLGDNTIIDTIVDALQAGSKGM